MGRTVFFGKFNKQGDRLWGSFLGGGSGDRSTSLVTDSSYHIYIVGRTRSSDIFKSEVRDTIPSAHQSSINVNNNKRDAFILHFPDPFPIDSIDVILNLSDTAFCPGASIIIDFQFLN